MSKWKRRLLRYGVPALLAWLAVSHFVVRPALEDWLADHFTGRAEVSFALIWPHFAVTAFGVTIEAENHTLSASRVGVDLYLWSIFGGRKVKGVDITGMVAELEEGERLEIFRRDGAGGSGDTIDEIDLDPVRVPPIRFSEPRILVRASGWSIFSTDFLEAVQQGDDLYQLRGGAGVVAGIPFEKLTARLMPRGDHVIVGGVKLRSFNGMIAGFADVDTNKTGVINGELEWYVLEAERIWRTYDLPYAEKRRGDVTGRLIFESWGFSPSQLRGKGRLRLERAEFFSPLSFKVFFILKIPQAQEAPLNSAEAEFSFEKEVLYLEQGRAYARDFDLRGRGLLTFDGQIDMEVDHAGTTVAVRGDIDDPRVKVLPFDYITLPFDRLFRERIGKR